MKKDQEKKKTPILVQMAIFAAILFVSQIISQLFPANIVVPTPLIGMIILYILLATHIVKLEQVEKFGDFMIGLIAFLFVPSGIQLAGSLDLMKREGLQDIIVVVISTIILLVVIAYVGAFFIRIHQKITSKKGDDE
ncbi:murein hydrolase regulator LrgA [Pediococcus acidilactici]|uniref:CidA/LrgA family protein n=1 Tax=Pediococcus acidilactici TaxID=1254 RepID=UPI00071AF802|nr:CidA/LrgA family protein [Pediococcus acidilactici]KSV55960.1 murein hydrolase regulator LrgA [Pediococcus acidilactici]